MSVFKCKMCGGTLEINADQSTAVCEYCGTQQTLPKLNDDKRTNLYDRANHFRRNNEFDKAMGIYEKILNDDSTDAEAYWSIVLCRYGIEYVEDPSTHKRVPTVNRAQFTSIFDDDNYKSALQYADSYQKTIYEEEANAINEIQKGILAISQKEDPFDVFICYKETDNNDQRTPDSVLANELYYQLTQDGFRVFFSRITLEDKLGSAYEPYIFAALNSAKVMVVLGTKPEFFNAVWVKNEWSRYLALIKNGAKKMLIPAYKDMDPYDLPEEFSHLQALDMSRLGFMQDLIRGITKIMDTDKPKTTIAKEPSTSNANAAALLERAFLFLEDGSWDEADTYCEKVLDLEPKNAHAYAGKLMAELHVRKQDDLKDQSEPFDSKKNYEKVLRFGDEQLKNDFLGYINFINTRNENARLEDLYNQARSLMDRAKTEKGYLEAAQRFETIAEYKDSAALAKDCYDRAETARKDDILFRAKAKMANVAILPSVSDYEAAIDLFESISGWKDADEQARDCKRKIEETKEREEIARREAKRNRIVAIITTLAVCTVIAVIILWNANNKYNDAVALMNAGKYEEAIEAFEALGIYRDSASRVRNYYISNFGEEAYQKIKNIQIGDSYTLGAYEQDNQTFNDKEKINWIVVDKQGASVCLVSKYALDCKPYNISSTYVTWETCSLRKWLNNAFFYTAFSPEEQKIIETTTVSADKNPNSVANPGNATQDKVFLLSIAESKEYFSKSYERACAPTDYAIDQGADDSYYASSHDTTWWLRSPGYYQNTAAYVSGDSDGENIHSTGLDVNSSDIAIRPALWITMDSRNLK